MMTEQEARKKVIEAGKLLLEKQLVARTWGNISARLDETHFVITPSGRPYETLTAEDLVKVCLTDMTYEGDRKPSSEKGIHAAAYALRPEVSFVIHTHQFYASVLAASGQGLEGAPCAAYGLPGTGRLKDNVAGAIREYPEADSFLMEKHGALLLGKDAEQAFALAADLEEKAEQAFGELVSRARSAAPEVTEETVLPDGTTLVSVSDTVTRLYAEKGKALPAYIDDFAQLMGPSVPIKQKESRPGAGKALLWKDGTGLCAARDPEDARAMAFILRKNCAAALWSEALRSKANETASVTSAGKTKGLPIRKPLGSPPGSPMRLADALLQQTVYRLKYSKLKNKA